jgi:ADP-ribose pyrophosphatase YjhB (NUDIX family)
VHYRNPRVIYGCVAEWEGGVLLCRRAIEPRRGRWTLPARFMENGDIVREGPDFGHYRVSML